MNPDYPDNGESLCAGILDEARAEAERLILLARQEAQSYLGTTTGAEEEKRQEKLSLAEKECARRKARMQASLPVERERLRAIRLETLLTTIHDEIQHRLQTHDGFNYPDMLVALAAQAITRMTGTDFIVSVSPADYAAMGPNFAESIFQHTGKSGLIIHIESDPKLVEGGLFIRDSVGHQEWDNRLSVRLQRLWPDLRLQLAAMIPDSMLKNTTPIRDVPAGTPRLISITNPSTRAVVTRVNGPVVTATGLTGAVMHEVVQVGERGLVGEIVRLNGDQATIQVYENTTMLKPGAAVQCTGTPLSVWLGPGLIGNIFDGIQRPLPAIKTRHGAWLERGEKVDPLDTSSQWNFEPAIRPGEIVSPGQTLGFVTETPLIRHKIMVPPDQSGTVRSVVDKGVYKLLSTVVVLDTPNGVLEISLLQKWPVRIMRPTRERRPVTQPLITGQRIIDTFFPIGKGGCAAIPGGFGTGKTITQHQLAKWSDADVIVFIGCGERGNEMTEVLREFPKIMDPKTGRPLMERTILIANTSNMPVAAREASIYTGITLAEYYRDMGLHVAVFADSTSRWAEALRELAARLEEMPAEEGFPSTLPTRLAQFYERGGAVTTLAGTLGSISIVGAVSPPGGDFSEPVTQHTQRFIRCFWALDTELANARHYPSIHWIRSYSDYISEVSEWWEKREPEWLALRTEALTLLQREDRLLQIVKLIGADALPDAQRLILFLAEILKDGFLAQNAFDETDQYCSPERQAALLKIMMMVYHSSRDLIQAGVALARIQELPSLASLIHAKSDYGNEALEKLEMLSQRIQLELDALAVPAPAPTLQPPSVV